MESKVNDQQIEQEIQDKGLNAPRLTSSDIQNVIVGEQYYVFPGTTLTVCCLTLKNGACVTGESACVSPSNFNAEIGQKIAKENAVREIWALEGYLLREKLAAGWICPDCSCVFNFGVPKKCPHNATGCDDLLAQGK